MDSPGSEIAVWRPYITSNHTPKRLQCNNAYPQKRREAKWLKYFSLDRAQGIAVCKICQKSISHNHGKPTSNLIKHLKTSGNNEQVRLLHRQAFENYTSSERISGFEQNDEPFHGNSQLLNYWPVVIHHTPIILNWLHRGEQQYNHYVAQVPSFSSG